MELRYQHSQLTALHTGGPSILWWKRRSSSVFSAAASAFYNRRRGGPWAGYPFTPGGCRFRSRRVFMAGQHATRDEAEHAEAAVMLLMEHLGTERGC